jgi:simple sugar transport system permease protein
VTVEDTPAPPEAVEPVPPSGERESDRRLFDEIVGIGTSVRRAVLLPLLALVTALLASGLIIAVSDIDNLRRLGDEPLEAIGDILSTIGDAYWELLVGSVGSLQAISETLNAATPLIFTGLAVAVGFRAGFFNIGANGQLIMGGMAGLWVAINFESLPGPLHLLLAVVAGLLGGGAWGFIPGILRARTGAHEVIVTIMLNFVALRYLDWLLKSSAFQAEGRDDPISQAADPDARLPHLLGFLDRSELRVHLGLVLAIVTVIVIQWMLTRSTLGFQFRALGANPYAARYAGMSIASLTVIALTMSGAIAGLAGVNQILGVQYQASANFQGTLGFDGITVALLGRSSPYGVLAAALLFGALRAGGQEMQATTDVPIDLILVVQALVVVFIAAPALIRAIWRIKVEDHVDSTAPTGLAS